MKQKKFLAGLAEFQNSDALLSEMERWEFVLNRQQNIQRVTESNRAQFFAELCQENKPDSYLTSPAYYVATGRKGLWLYREKGTVIPLCWHPNVPGQILVFPQLGEKNPNTVYNLLKQIPEPPAGLRLARIGLDSDWAMLLDKVINIPAYSMLSMPVIEQIMDWKYPVRILSTEKIMQMKGKKYKCIRNRVRQTKHYDIRVENLSTHHKHELENFIYNWAHKRSEDMNKICEYTSFYKTILNEFNKNDMNLDGIVFYIDDKIQAFTIWDISNLKTPIANRFINLCNVSYRGLSDYVMVTTATVLYSKGIRYVNLGGSETTSLDSFKKKFVPERSVELCSIDIMEILNPEINELTQLAEKGRVLI